jgi:phosphoadenosine phosphosulfate reductase
MIAEPTLAKPQSAAAHVARTLERLARAISKDHPGRIALVSSFGADAAVLLHLVARIDRATPVIFIDTGKLFGETLRYRDALLAQLGLTDLRTIGPRQGEESQVDPEGILFASDPDRCCHMRKVIPLARALEPFDAWINGRKRFQASSRAMLEPVETADGKTKYNPLFDWTAEDIAGYFADQNLPPHPLVADGFLSIGCMPCSDRTQAGEDPRAGRWRGQTKDECGIHTLAPTSLRDE